MQNVKFLHYRYELRSIRLEKLKSLAAEDQESSKDSGWEVEMSDAKQVSSLQPPTP